jgi:GWxTD domain-containing protein
MSDRAPALLLLALLAAGCAGGASAPRSLAELTNPFLGPAYTAWLAGPIARIATAQEISEYLALRDDAPAAAFIEGFWQRRDPSAEKPGNPFRETFERRAAEADRLYSEAGFLGRRTDRGVLHVLYGPPQRVDYEVSPVPHGPPIEVWTYGGASPSGLDGKRPSPVHRFIKQGDLTVLYFPGVRSGPLVPPLEPDNP